MLAGTDPPNTASSRGIEKLGMRYVGEMAPDRFGTLYFALSREDFRNRDEDGS